MQISGVSLTLTWAPQALFTQSSSGPHHHCYKLSPFQAHWGRWHCTSFLRPACLFTVHMGSGSSPISCGVFLPLPLLQAFLLLVAGCVLPLLPSPAVCCEGFPLPHSSELRVPRPLCYVSFLLLLVIIQFFFFFFPGWGSVCPVDYADLAQGCLWEYCVLLSSPCGPRLLKQQRRSPPGFSV
jgi:hypothetical protein